MGDENSVSCLIKSLNDIKKIKAPIGDENKKAVNMSATANRIKKIKAPIGDENIVPALTSFLLSMH